MNIIETERLILRTWQKEDAEAYFRINQDPKVIEFLTGPLTMEQVNAFITGANKQFEERGFTLWATCLKETGELIGWVGLNYLDFQAHFTPAVEIGWRLGSQYWGKGYATEAAKAVLDYGFNRLNLKELVSCTVPDNTRSRRVMEKLGMIRDPNEDFRNPKLDPSHRFSKVVLYRVKAVSN
jgi:RimJ/RimL family protein N-acetyltransferase